MPIKSSFLILLTFQAFDVCAENSRPIILGLGTNEADKHNVEFMKYDRWVPLLRKNGIRTAMLESSAFYRRDWPAERLYQELKKFEVVHLRTTNEGVTRVTAAYERRAKQASAVLARYVREGGGLFIQCQPVRYTNDEDEKYWNLFLKRFGLQILHEGVFDKTRPFEGRTLGKFTFWFTGNVSSHSVTEGVRHLYLPLHSAGRYPGLVALDYSAEWQVVVRGHKEAKSYRSGKGGEPNIVNLDADGTYKVEPPVVAVRQFGEGRIVSYPISGLFTGINYGKKLWSHTVETSGDPVSGRASDSMRLQMNAYLWLAEAARKKGGFGTYEFKPYRAVQFPPTVHYDGHRFPEAAKTGNGVRGVVGLHSDHSDGESTVADYVKAAKDAGLSFIVFAAPMEHLTAEKLDKLKQDCAKGSDASFYACPGIEFTDGSGIRWTMWGEKVVFPEATFKNGKHTYTQWDGKRIRHFGKFAHDTGFSPCAVLDYKQLRAKGAHPENLWWFFYYTPLVYERDKLIADNFNEYLYGLRDLRWSAVASFTRIRSSKDVALAAKTSFTGYRNLAAAKRCFNTRTAATFVAWHGGQYLSGGPVIAYWGGNNTQMESNWRITRGAQRIRLNFVVRSDIGVKDIKVLDADRGIFRRFAGNGAKEIAREFEMVHDKNHYLVLEVTDTAGKKAISQYAFVYSYKQSLFRCGDNLNILGGTGLVWHPDRHEMLPMQKQFINGGDEALSGYDTGSQSLGVKTPIVRPWSMIRIKGQSDWYPSPYKIKKLMARYLDVPLASYNIQIARMAMKNFSEIYETTERPQPAIGSVLLDQGEIEFFERTHTMVAPMHRQDMYVSWNYRRGREGRKNYRGGLIWHEGEIRFKKDVTLQGRVPIPLVTMRCPFDLEHGWGDTAIITDADAGTRVFLLRDEDKKLRTGGRLKPGGYAAQMPTAVGYNGFLAPHDMNFSYEFVHKGWPGSIWIGFGRDGQKVKAGTVMKYRYAIGTFADSQGGNDLLEHTVKAMNMGGGSDGYAVQMKAGELADGTFFFTATAKDNEAFFKLGPQKLLIDLPIKVQGLEDNGCAAIYSTKRKWFRFVPILNGAAHFQEPIDTANEMWVGNIFVTENKDLKLTAVIDGQAPGKPPFVEVHNPTSQLVKTNLWSPANTPIFGGQKREIEVPPGASIRLTGLTKK